MAGVSKSLKEMEGFFELILIPLMTWQLRIIELLNRLPVVGISVRRQTGKTQLVVAMMMAKALQLKPNGEGHSSIFFGISDTQVKDVLRRALKAARVLDSMGLIEKISPSHGQQMIVFKNGARLFFRIQTDDQFEGVTDIDFIIYDEAQQLSDEFVTDTMPLADNSEDSCVVFLGTPPTDKDFRKAGRNAFHRLHDKGGESWVEYSAYLEYRTDLVCDIEAAKRADPSWRRKKGFAKKIQSYLDVMSHEAFCQDILGVWKNRDVIEIIPPILTPQQVKQLMVGKSGASKESTFVCSIGLDVGHDKLYVAMSDVRNVIEVVEEFDINGQLDAAVQWIESKGRTIKKVNIPGTQRGKVMAKLIRSACKTPVEIIDVAEMGARIDRFMAYLPDNKVKVYDGLFGEQLAVSSFYLGFDTRSGTHFVDAPGAREKAVVLALIAGTEVYKEASYMSQEALKALVG